MNNQVFYFLFLIVLFSGCSHLTAQEKKSEDKLYTEIAHMDSVLFNAFNSRDTLTFKKFFTEDLEFYHDKGGLTGYQHTIEFMRSTAKSTNGLRRDLVPGSLEVYPIPNYGAMEIGAHTFCHQENGKQDCGTFKFVHIWKKVGNEWKIARVVSYGH
ncbi:MAG: nuclear transport factor 2 family protein [Flavisolibacter sp.]|nr:nuclear transport factor 2 family protein [Flavisolibacter sp.]